MEHLSTRDKLWLIEHYSERIGMVNPRNLSRFNNQGEAREEAHNYIGIIRSIECREILRPWHEIRSAALLTGEAANKQKQVVDHVYRSQSEKSEMEDEARIKSKAARALLARSFKLQQLNDTPRRQIRMLLGYYTGLTDEIEEILASNETPPTPPLIDEYWRNFEIIKVLDRSLTTLWRRLQCSERLLRDTYEAEVQEWDCRELNLARIKVTYWLIGH